jgi:hypothetical protein
MSQSRPVQPSENSPSLEILLGGYVWTWRGPNPAAWLLERSALSNPWVSTETRRIPGNLRQGVLESLTGAARVTGQDFYGDQVTGHSNAVLLANPPTEPSIHPVLSANDSSLSWTWTGANPPYWGWMKSPTSATGPWTYSGSYSGSSRGPIPGAGGYWNYVYGENPDQTLIDPPGKSNVLFTP